MTRFVEFVRRNPVRVYGAVNALLALVAFYLPAAPVALILGVAAAAIALAGGEIAQRVENTKTDQALFQPVPDEYDVPAFDDEADYEGTDEIDGP